MALMITEDCTACDACVDQCPNQAIDRADGIVFVIDPDRCTECVGHFDESQCTLVCPADCIVADPRFEETREQLQAKFDAL